MSEESLYLVNLEFSTENFGGASMKLQLAVDPVNNTITGCADGTIEEGTQFSPNFAASAAGHIYSTGLGGITKIGAVSGQTVVSVPPPAIGSYLVPFSANFAVDNDWNGEGNFSVGTNTYTCKVTKACKCE